MKKIKSENVIFNNGIFIITSYRKDMISDSKIYVNGEPAKNFNVEVVNKQEEKISPYNPKAITPKVNASEILPFKLVFLDTVSLIHVNRKKSSLTIESTNLNLIRKTIN
jgi:hypothetical protein